MNNAKLNPEFKKKWVEALRSNKYKQVTGVLLQVTPKSRKPIGHCCLGVACDLVFQEGIDMDLDFHTTENLDKQHVVVFNDNWELPPVSVDAQCMDTGKLADLKVTINNFTRNLFEHNDKGATFKEIADAIEEQL